MKSIPLPGVSPLTKVTEECLRAVKDLTLSSEELQAVIIDVSEQGPNNYPTTLRGGTRNKRLTEGLVMCRLFLYSNLTLNG